MFGMVMATIKRLDRLAGSIAPFSKHQRRAGSPLDQRTSTSRLRADMDSIIAAESSASSAQRDVYANAMAGKTRPARVSIPECMIIQGKPVHSPSAHFLAACTLSAQERAPEDWKVETLGEVVPRRERPSERAAWGARERGRSRTGALWAGMRAAMGRGECGMVGEEDEPSYQQWRKDANESVLVPISICLLLGITTAGVLMLVRWLGWL